MCNDWYKEPFLGNFALVNIITLLRINFLHFHISYVEEKTVVTSCVD